MYICMRCRRLASFAEWHTLKTDEILITLKFTCSHTFSLATQSVKPPSFYYLTSGTYNYLFVFFFIINEALTLRPGIIEELLSNYSV